MGERVPYVIIYGEPGKPLIQSVRSPEEVISEQNQHSSLRPNAVYYITKVIVPALARCLSLVGADVSNWYINSKRFCIFNAMFFFMLGTLNCPR